MKISIEWVVDSLLFTFFILLALGILSIGSQINQAYNYHHYVVSQVSNSHFDTTVMANLQQNNRYQIAYTQHTIDHDLAMYPSEQLYTIETNYSLSIPIIGYKSHQQISTIAR